MSSLRQQSNEGASSRYKPQHQQSGADLGQRPDEVKAFLEIFIS